MFIMLILIRPTGCGFHEFLRVGAGGFGMPETQTCSPSKLLLDGLAFMFLQINPIP